MKVVLLHDWLTGFRGGERVLEVLCQMFPDAPLYTLIHKKGSVPKSIENRKITTSFLNKIPGIHRHYRKFLPFFPLAASLLKIEEEADLVISSSHCVIKGVKIPFGAKHISYIHSPMRYLYDQYDNYFGPGSPFYQRLGMRFFKNYLTKWDIESNKNVHVLLANSLFVQKRIERYYALPSQVVHPFVELEDFRDARGQRAKEGFYLMVSAFAPNKKVDLAVEAFNQMGLPLKIIGSGQKEGELKAMANSNIEFLGNLSREEVIDHFFRAKAFIFPGVEDFGITPLESLASGTPVIAYKVGGVLETLNEDVAQFFETLSVEALIEGVRHFEKKHIDSEKLYARADEFSKEVFRQNIKKVIEETLRSEA
jgi:glycosyltransferase involved in cell wall biosynthesis